MATPPSARPGSRRGARRTVGIGRALLVAALLLAAIGVAPTTGAGAQTAEVVIDLDRTIQTGASAMAVGATHTQYSLDPWADPDAQQRGRDLLAAGVQYQNQHIYGWGGINPNPAPGVYDWTALDRRIQLMRDTGAVPVITLCCAPDWMTDLGTETSRYRNRPPLHAHLPDFADLAVRIAQRYPDVGHFVVWNEMKGLWNPGAGTWDYVAYTDLYNAVYDALKAHDPTIAVGGPYLVIEGTGSDGDAWFQWDPVTRRNRLVIEYWLEHAHGADFVALDKNVKDYHDGRDYTYQERLALTPTFAEVVDDVTALTDLPIWYIEQHFAGKFSGPLDYQAVGATSVLLHQLLAGTAVTLQWEPEQRVPGGPVEGNLFSSARQAGGAMPYPTYDGYRIIHELFGPGTELFQATSTDPMVEVLASATHTLVLNKHDVTTSVDLAGTPVDLDPWSINLFDAAGDPVVLPPVDPPVATSGAAPMTQSAPAATSIDPPGESQDGTVEDDRWNDVAASDDAFFVVGQTSGPLSGTGFGYGDGIVARVDHGGDIVWLDQFGTDTDQGASGVTVTDDAVYVVGSTDAPLDGSPGIGGFDLFIRRYTHDGVLEWHRRIATAGNDFATNVVPVLDGVVVSAHSDAGRGAPNAGYQDGMLLHIRADGRPGWTRMIGGPGGDVLTDVTFVDDLVVAVGFTSDVVGADPAAGSWDSFAVATNLAGQVQWVRQFGTAGPDKARSITPDGTGGLLVAGTFEDPSAGTNVDGFVVPLALDGTVGALAPIGSPAADSVDAVVVEDGTVLVAGSTRGDIGAGPALETDLFVAAIDGATPTQVWQFASTANEDARGLGALLGRFLVAGQTSGSLFGPPAGKADAVLAARDLAGTVVAADPFATPDPGTWPASAVTGQTWTTSSSPGLDFSVAGGTGVLSAAPGSSGTATIDGLASSDVTMAFDLTLDQRPMGRDLYLYGHLRAGADDEYRIAVRIRPDGTVYFRPVARAGGWSPLADFTLVDGFRIDPGVTVRVVMTATGANPTTLSAGIGPATAPVTALPLADDATSALQDPGTVGVSAVVSTQATAPVVAHVDDVVVTTG